MNVGRRILGAACLAALVAVPTRTAADGATHSDVAFSDMVVLNSCTNEEVVISGVMTTTALSKFDASGGLHISFGVVTKGTGVGSITGTQYPYKENDLASLQAGSATTFTIRVKARLKGPGSIDDWEMTLMNHITLNPDGTITSTVEKDTTTCRG